MVDFGGGRGGAGWRHKTFEHRISRGGGLRHRPGQARPRGLNFICLTTDFIDDTDKKGRDSHPCHPAIRGEKSCLNFLSFARVAGMLMA
jgi:hypothetical protein